MFRDLHFGTRRLGAIACAVFLVACAGTGEQGGYKQLTSPDVAKVTQGMTRQEVEHALGRPQKGEQRDRHGNVVLNYRYASPGAGYTGTAYLFVTIDPASGKVIQVSSELH